VGGKGKEGRGGGGGLGVRRVGREWGRKGVEGGRRRGGLRGGSASWI